VRLAISWNFSIKKIIIKKAVENAIVIWDKWAEFPSENGVILNLLPVQFLPLVKNRVAQNL
jgi:hypothetical protein